tara:strand:- start:4911 stop:5456 length:546 start_codon:yes stop_codon:yes gene_type:complete
MTDKETKQLLYTWLQGKFENKIQAFSNPSKYAMIQVSHTAIMEGKYLYGEQAYTYQLQKPYRQFVLQIVRNAKSYTLLNYDIISNKLEFAGSKNLDKITKDMIECRNGCDVDLTFNGTAFVGGLTGCDCHVVWNGTETYLQNEVELTENFYGVKDLGYDKKHGHQIWGSKYGRFEFNRLPN